jgi:hypothetical protein
MILYLGQVALGQLQCRDRHIDGNALRTTYRRTKHSSDDVFALTVNPVLPVKPVLRERNMVLVCRPSSSRCCSLLCWLRPSIIRGNALVRGGSLNSCEVPTHFCTVILTSPVSIRQHRQGTPRYRSWQRLLGLRIRPFEDSSSAVRDRVIFEWLIFDWVKNITWRDLSRRSSVFVAKCAVRHWDLHRFGSFKMKVKHLEIRLAGLCRNPCYISVRLTFDVRRAIGAKWGQRGKKATCMWHYAR